MKRKDRKKNKPKGGIGQKLKKDIRGYFSESTVHGLRYIVAGGNAFERAAWVLFIAIGFLYCGHTIFNAYHEWEIHPVQTTIDEVGVPVQELPFPAITVCDTASLTMPRRNRWMFLEQLLNGVELKNPDKLAQNMYPGNIQQSYFYSKIRNYFKSYFNAF